MLVYLSNGVPTIKTVQYLISNVRKFIVATLKGESSDLSSRVVSLQLIPKS